MKYPKRGHSVVQWEKKKSTKKGNINNNHKTPEEAIKMVSHVISTKQFLKLLTTKLCKYGKTFDEITAPGEALKSGRMFVGI